MACSASHHHQGGSHDGPHAPHEEGGATQTEGQPEVPRHEPAHGPANRLRGGGSARGDMENRIKEMHHGVSMDRLSCKRFLANQLRLVLHTAATILLQTVRQAAEGSSLAAAQVTTLRERLLKMAAWSVCVLAVSPCACRSMRLGKRNGGTSSPGFTPPSEPFGTTATQPANRPAIHDRASHLMALRTQINPITTAQQAPQRLQQARQARNASNHPAVGTPPHQHQARRPTKTAQRTALMNNAG